MRALGSAPCLSSGKRSTCGDGGSTHRAGLLAILVIGLPFVPASAAQAAEPSIAGGYHCKSLCRLTDAAPSVEIVGSVAKCMNELGGTFSGKVLSANVIACFNKTGTLSKDGKTIEWSDGVVWTR